jgi:2-keto-4-pentenoate hydratase/2-oxohepta-3-ene-1,7-dioic acid hydratase in catechol pathway
MTAPTFFRYADPVALGGHHDGARVGCWLDDGTAHDVCGPLHGDGGGPYDSDGCLIAAVLDHVAVLDRLTSRPVPIRPGRILPVVGRPRNVFGAPVNYLAHRGELGAARSPAPGSTTRELGLFVKAGGSVSGPGDPVELPDRPDREFQYEGEIAVVIGRPGFDVPAGDALTLVAGFTGALDVTMRLEPDKREERSMRKSFRTFTPVGPAVLPFTDPAQATALALSLALNGEVRQTGSLDQLIVGVAELVALASSVVPLEPGDLILTGTPSGVGGLAGGDVVELAVTGLPTLRLDVTVRGNDG